MDNSSIFSKFTNFDRTLTLYLHRSMYQVCSIHHTVNLLLLWILVGCTATEHFSTIESPAINYHNDRIYNAENIDLSTSYALSLPQSEYNALHDLFISTGGNDWTWTLPVTVNGFPWRFDNVSDPCLNQWQGIACRCTKDLFNNTKCITESISLAEMNLAGSIPDSISAFSEMIFLYLTDNKITGPIPETLGDLGYLETVRIYSFSLKLFPSPV